ncbi:unnamed protein product [Mycena citricolor]|uniref:Uncharacterized protein n=1 Tax=Mycena citricolor TaxID=2018698 RepID=A0AAD2HV05_9AGAR|nr:unnamed protein product [Mycena citricolor]CAK5282651.1 unnamed protein product [Mycena citricolor]
MLVHPRRLIRPSPFYLAQTSRACLLLDYYALYPLRDSRSSCWAGGSRTHHTRRVSLHTRGGGSTWMCLLYPAQRIALRPLRRNQHTSFRVVRIFVVVYWARQEREGARMDENSW